MAATSRFSCLVVVALCMTLVYAGCNSDKRDDDPLINPNINAQIEDPNNNNTGNTGTSGPGILTINPTSVNIPVSEIMTFTAAGGIPPYVFSFADSTNAVYNSLNDTWTHNITNATLTGTGVFTAGPGIGTNQIRVTDSAASMSDATVNIITPTTTSYKIVSTNLTPYVSRITVPTNTKVYFVIQNGTDPDSFNVTNNSSGKPQGFVMGTRAGCWETGNTGADDGSVCDILQVFDSSTPINVATLRIYVSTTPLAISPKTVVVPATTQVSLLASPGGVNTLTWAFAGGSAPSGGTLLPAGTSATYTAGSTTNGIFGAKDIIEVRDSFPFVPQVAQAQANVPGLSVFPRRFSMAPSTQKILTALGGSGTYNWTNMSPSLVSLAPAGASCTVTALTAEGEATIALSDTTPGGSLTVTAVVCGAVTSHSFTAPGTFYPSNGSMGSSSFYPLDMAVADFDKNGVQDVVVSLSSSSVNPVPYGDTQGNQVSVLLGGATKGSFQQSAVHYQMATTGTAGPTGITTGDFNGDTNIDIAVACQAGYVVVMLGAGDGTFPNSTTYPFIYANLGGGFRGADIVKYNFDRSNGDDLAVCDGAGGRVAVLISNGSANSFNVVSTLTISDPVPTDSYLPTCLGIAVGNFDNDTTGSINKTGNSPNGIGYIDIAVTDYYYDRVVIFDGTGLTAWNPAGTAFSVDPSPTAPSVCMQKPVGIAAGDVDGDGDMDIVTANNQHYWQYSTTNLEMGISVIVNNSGGTLNFSIAREYGPDRSAYPDYYACYFWSVLCYDFNNDGLDDVAALARCIRLDPPASYSWRSSHVLLWRGVGGAGMLNGWSRNGTTNDNYATSVFPQSTGADWDFYGGAFAAIDFAGHTRNNAGAPLMDIILSAGCPYAWYTYYGKMTVLMNNSD